MGTKRNKDKTKGDTAVSLLLLVSTYNIRKHGDLLQAIMNYRFFLLQSMMFVKKHKLIGRLLLQRTIFGSFLDFSAMTSMS
jgi:hypothetical protein